MARNLKFYFDESGMPCARGPQSEQLLMAFLETDLQGNEQLCHDLLEDIQAIESEAASEREFIGNAHSLLISEDAIEITCHAAEEIEDDDNSGAEIRSSNSSTPNPVEGTETTATASSLPENNASTDSVVSAVVTTAAQGATSPDTKRATNQTKYSTSLRHFREIVEDWEAFIIDEKPI